MVKYGIDLFGEPITFLPEADGKFYVKLTKARIEKAKKLIKDKGYGLWLATYPGFEERIISNEGAKKFNKFNQYKYIYFAPYNWIHLAKYKNKREFLIKVMEKKPLTRKITKRTYFVLKYASKKKKINASDAKRECEALKKVRRTASITNLFKRLENEGLLRRLGYGRSKYVRREVLEFKITKKGLMAIKDYENVMKKRKRR
ncbi:MAG: hypothetical protein ACTSPL_03975 [Candidatus Odinarchaeia archaeon]